MEHQKSASEKFERECRSIALDDIVFFRTLKEKGHATKYKQIAASIKVLGLVEAPVVYPLKGQTGKFGLLDGHLRVRALKELGHSTVACLIAKEDDTYTYNRQINRLTPAQDYKMISAAIRQGVSEKKLAAALHLSDSAFQRHKTLMKGICPEARAMLEAKDCPREVFVVLKKLKPLRQIEACELMEGHNAYTVAFVRAIFAASPPEQRVTLSRKPIELDSLEQLAKLERELATLQEQMRTVEATYGPDVLRFTVLQAFIAEVLSSPTLTLILEMRYPDFLKQFRKISEMNSLPNEQREEDIA